MDSIFSSRALSKSLYSNSTSLSCGRAHVNYYSVRDVCALVYKVKQALSLSGLWRRSVAIVLLVSP